MSAFLAIVLLRRELWINLNQKIQCPNIPFIKESKKIQKLIRNRNMTNAKQPKRLNNRSKRY